MTEHRLEVTVVLPVLNRATMLAESLAAIEGQTLAPLEVLVVDGGSIDGSIDVARASDIARLIELPGSNVPDAHNQAIDEARGTVIAFAASDDLLDPQALDRHVDALDRSSDLAMSVGLTEFVAEQPGEAVPGGLAGTTRRARVLEAIAVRREVFSTYGDFRADLGSSADLEWVSRVTDAGIATAEIDSVVVRKRLHSGNVTYSHPQTRGEVLEALWAGIVRRRSPA
jgi:glycosyltransferase involved in cell wall biosynthesis